MKVSIEKLENGFLLEEDNYLYGLKDKEQKPDRKWVCRDLSEAFTRVGILFEVKKEGEKECKTN